MEKTPEDKVLGTLVAKSRNHSFVYVDPRTGRSKLVFVDPRTGKWLNPMCENCACLHDSCDGERKLFYTGCIWRRSKQIQPGGYAH